MPKISLRGQVVNAKPKYSPDASGGYNNEQFGGCLIKIKQI